jgi:hypothetical protein
MNRRQFVVKGSLAAAAWSLTDPLLLAGQSGSDPERDGAPHAFTSDDADLTRVYQTALATLGRNIVSLPPYPAPVLIEGSVYAGVWLE